MSTRKRNLTPGDMERAFAGDGAAFFPPIMSPADLARLLQLSVKTVYEWIAQGRLDGAFRKRGKHCLIWRDRARHHLQWIGLETMPNNEDKKRIRIGDRVTIYPRGSLR